MKLKKKFLFLRYSSSLVTWWGMKLSWEQQPLLSSLSLSALLCLKRNNLLLCFGMCMVCVSVHVYVCASVCSPVHVHVHSCEWGHVCGGQRSTLGSYFPHCLTQEPLPCAWQVSWPVSFRGFSCICFQGCKSSPRVLLSWTLALCHPASASPTKHSP